MARMSKIVTHCHQCKQLGFRADEYFLPYCKERDENLKINVFWQKPSWCIDEQGDQNNED
jgi:hypothetical protein